MTFSTEELALFERQYKWMRGRVDDVRHSDVLGTRDESQYLWRRVDRLAAMSREEWMDELMADYRLFGCSFEE